MCCSLLCGDPKTWSFLTSGSRDAYDAMLAADATLYSLVRNKRSYGCWPRGLDAFVVLQQPGTTVVTLTGNVWHQTTSLGASIAEAINSWMGYSHAGHSEALDRTVAADAALLKGTQAGKVARLIHRGYKRTLGLVGGATPKPPGNGAAPP